MTTDQIPKVHDGGPAFARPMGSAPGKYNASQPGMTLRDYFAAKAMMSIMQHPICKSYAFAATEAYKMADAMLVARGEA